MVSLTIMNNRSKLAILVILSFVITTVPTSDGYSSGVHNQASNGCSCHYSVAAITANHTFPTEYIPGDIYSIAINVNGGTQSFNGGFNVMVNKGTMYNPGSFVSINPAGTSATHSGTNNLGWSFDWEAPLPGSGNVVVNIAALQSNANGNYNGDTWDSLTHTIVEFQPPNDPPVAYDINITSATGIGSTAPVNSDLNLNYQFGDPNNDPESGTIIHWFIDGIKSSAYDDQTVISAASTSIGQKWKAEITPSDGEDFGATETTIEVTIIDIDSDNDGVFDSNDAFPNDPNESVDSDSDGVGDNGDAFPNDASETADSDMDGVGDNADAFPDDASETTDSDQDGVGDNADAFPNDASETIDSDSDGVGDNADAFPNDSTETTDSDQDGVGDNSDVFPYDSTETTDSDLDGVGDNADVFPNDANETLDSDMDGVGDNADAFPNDANETLDSDMDGVGDNSDAFPNDANETLDSDMDGVGDNADAFPNDANETLDSDMDGVGDNADVFPDDASETIDSDQDGVGDNADAFPNDSSETLDSDMDGVGDNADAFPDDANETLDSDMDGVGDNADAFPNDASETMDSDGDGVGDNAQALAEAESKEDSDNTMLVIGLVSGIIVVILAVLFFLRKDESTPLNELDNSKDYTQNMNTFSANPYQNTNQTMQQQIPPTNVTLAQPVVSAPSVIQQWTDASGHTWRQMSDGSTEWWNGTDWQKS
jgi:hypothetical protein